MSTKELTVKKRILARFPPRRVLVPMDLTKESLAGWRQAQIAAGWFHADIEAVYVQPWMGASQTLAVAAGAAIEPITSETFLKDAMKQLRRKLGDGVVINGFAGEIEDGILSWARDGFDLIVMATHGRTGFSRALYGSVAEHVVRHSPIPVLVVRDRIPSVGSVLAPISFEPESWSGLLAAGHAAERLGGRLDVLHVVTGGIPGHAAVHGLKRIMEDWVGRLPERIRRRCRPRVDIAFGSAPDRICEAAERSGLVVLTAHCKGLLSETVLGTTAERVLRHCPTPILAIPSSARP